MSKVNSKREIIVVTNTKGGVGKSTVVNQCFPLIFHDVAIIEIDSSQKSKLKDSKINAQHFKAKAISEAVDEIDILSQEKQVIIDVGADENTRAFFEDINVIDDLNFHFMIPLNHDVEYTENVTDTYNMIKNFQSNAKVSLILNRAREDKSTRKQFFGIFGSEDLDIEEVISKMKIDNIFTLNESDFFGLAKVKYKKTLSEAEPDIKHFLKNKKEIRIKVREQGREAQKKSNADFRVAKQIIQLINDIRESFKELENGK